MDQHDFLNWAMDIVASYKMRLIGECHLCKLSLIDDDPYRVVHRIEDEIYCKTCYQFITRAKCVICNDKPCLYANAFCKDCCPKPYYIYSWTRPNELLPFYVGMSRMYNRINDLHFADPLNTRLAACELERQRHDTIIYKVLEEGLTKQQAGELEGLYFWKFRALGANLTNQVIPKQPLEKKKYTLNTNDILVKRYERN